MKKYTFEQAAILVNKPDYKHSMACWLDGWHCYCFSFVNPETRFSKLIKLKKELKSKEKSND